MSQEDDLEAIADVYGTHALFDSHLAEDGDPAGQVFVLVPVSCALDDGPERDALIAALEDLCAYLKECGPLDEGEHLLDRVRQSTQDGSMN